MRNRKFHKNSKTIKKKPIMASFQAKIGRKKTRNIKNKNYRFVSFQPGALYKIPKKI